MNEGKFIHNIVLRTLYSEHY